MYLGVATVCAVGRLVYDEREGTKYERLGEARVDLRKAALEQGRTAALAVPLVDGQETPAVVHIRLRWVPSPASSALNAVWRLLPRGLPSCLRGLPSCLQGLPSALEEYQNAAWRLLPRGLPSWLKE